MAEEEILGLVKSVYQEWVEGKWMNVSLSEMCVLAVSPMYALV